MLATILELQMKARGGEGGQDLLERAIFVDGSRGARSMMLVAGSQERVPSRTEIEAKSSPYLFYCWTMSKGKFNCIYLHN